MNPTRATNIEHYGECQDCTAYEKKIDRLYAKESELQGEVASLTSELKEALESYNRECKRNDELQAEVDRLKGTLGVEAARQNLEFKPAINELLSALIKARKRIAVNAHEESMVELDSTITKYSALSKHQPKKDETTIKG